MVSRSATLPAFRATAINGSLPLYFGFGSPRITGKYQVWLGEPRGIYARHPKWPRDVERNDTPHARSVGCAMKSAAPSEYGGYHWNAHMPCSHNFHLNGNEWQLPSALLDLQSQGGGAVALDRPHKHRALDSSLALSLSLSHSHSFTSQKDAGNSLHAYRCTGSHARCKPSGWRVWSCSRNPDSHFND